MKMALLNLVVVILFVHVTAVASFVDCPTGHATGSSSFQACVANSRRKRKIVGDILCILGNGFSNPEKCIKPRNTTAVTHHHTYLPTTATNTIATTTVPPPGLPQAIALGFQSTFDTYLDAISAPHDNG
ncbi:hypothetical protein BV898_03404 [Hypsibius exemplaris]|uniref:Secreted protein n=1 Tax=Hypsibius exemplaris TaxID=2072580 RepID=A0A1W0X575_HYPEX|nr:hypothetical protein BV898_03404 [Hypsibius exemplaris]